MRYASLILSLLLLPNLVFAANTASTNISVASSQSWSITDASQSGLDLTGNHSICGWYKFATEPVVNGNRIMVSKINTGTQRSYWLTARNNAGTERFEVSFSSDGSTTAYTGIFNYSINTATWYHICYTYATSGTVAFYVNGSAVTLTSSSGSVPASVFNSNVPFYIARFADSSSAEDFDGQVDDLLVYNTTLSSSDVAALYSTPCSPSTTNLVSRWKFDNDGNDSQGSNNLTNNNSATFTTDTAYSCPDYSNILIRAGTMMIRSAPVYNF